MAQRHKHIAMDTRLHAVVFNSDFYRLIRPDMGHGFYGYDVVAFVWRVAPSLLSPMTKNFSVSSGLPRPIMLPHQPS